LELEPISRKAYAFAEIKSKSEIPWRGAIISHRLETPFDSIESALEYMNLLLEATRESQEQVETEIVRATDSRLARRKQALQLVSHKLAKLSSHIATSRCILNDLRMLRRLLLEERKPPEDPSIA
jgi:signal transduction histidine kinase